MISGRGSGWSWWWPASYGSASLGPLPLLPIRGMAIPGVTVRVVVPGNAALMLTATRDRRRSGCRAPYARRLPRRRRKESLVQIELGARIGLDLAHDALQMQPAPGKLRGLTGDLGGVAAVEDSGDSRRKPGRRSLRCLTRKMPHCSGCRFSIFTALENHISTGMSERILMPVACGAPHDRLQMLVGIEDVPGRAVGTPATLHVVILAWAVTTCSSSYLFMSGSIQTFFSYRIL